VTILATQVAVSSGYNTGRAAVMYDRAMWLSLGMLLGQAWLLE